MVLVTPARRADLTEITEVVADAFLADPPTAAVLPRTVPRRRARLEAFFRAVVCSGPLSEGTVDVARDRDTGRILGAAIWHGPDHHASVLRHYLPQIPAFVKAVGPRGVVRAVAVSRASADHRPTAPHWYLQAMGVRTELQGRGVGSRLLRHRLAVADASGSAAYLESSTDATTMLYQRHGFAVLGLVTGFPGAAVPIAMWRPGRLRGVDGGPGTESEERALPPLTA